MENQFTQGPWRTFGGMVDGYGIMASDRTIVITQEAFNGLNHRANARLIAAAPQLHAALANAIRELKWAADNSKNYEEPVSLAVIQGCEAALALVDSNDDNDEPETATCEDCGEIDTIGALESGNHWCEKGKL